MRDKVLNWCRQERLLQSGDHVVCALSGGMDSVAMLHCLLSLRDALQITVSAAHYNHCLRGEASDEDEAFVRRLCASLEVPLVTERGDVLGRARETGESVEEAARHMRYAFLQRQEGLIAVAHHADDQVETVLLNLLRGTGLKGLCAMVPRQERIIRPLLTVTRQEIEKYVLEEGLSFREDATNGEDDALRNRLRHHVTPLLYRENPSLAQTVTRMTDLLRQDEAFLEEQTTDLLSRAKQETGWDCRVLLDAPQVLRRRAIRSLLTIPKPSMVHVDAVEGLLQDLSGSASVELPGGWIARREYALLQLEPKKTVGSLPEMAVKPGQRVCPDGTDMEIFVEGPIILEKTTDSLSTFAVKYDMMEENPTIGIRPRRTGDSLRLSGGQKSLKRLMIDRKIPAAKRECLPVITHEEQVLAVYGLGTDVRWAACPGDRALIVTIHIRGEK